MAEVSVSVGFRDDDYIFFPACVYCGNRFPVLQKKYPPMFTPDEAQTDLTLTITEVPRLNPDGSGCIEVTTGDVSVPCIGVYAPSLGRGYLLFTVQQIGGRNLGLSYESGVMRITCPARRSLVYTMMKLTPNPQPYEPLEAEIPHRMLEFACGSMEEFYRVFFENRRIMGMNDALPETISPEEQIRLHIEKYNRVNWRPHGEFYSVGDGDGKYSVWQAGWIGGAMATYMLLKCGGPLEKERAVLGRLRPGTRRFCGCTGRSPLRCRSICLRPNVPSGPITERFCRPDILTSG